MGETPKDLPKDLWDYLLEIASMCRETAEELVKLADYIEGQYRKRFSE